MKSTDWELELYREIDRIDWDAEANAATHKGVPHAEVTVYVAAEVVAELANAAHGRVNDKPLAGVGRGMVMLRDATSVFGVGKLTFAVRKDVPWNHFRIPMIDNPRPDHREVRDVDGNPPYPYFDFGMIP